MTTAIESKQRAKPNFNYKRADPLSYGVICPECSKRSGRPSEGGWIDIVACGPCAVTRAAKTKSERERGK